jgi:hypothetical protein
VLPRLWVVLLALLLLAAPASSTSAEIVDAQPSIGLLDDEALAHVKVPSTGGAPDRVALAARPDDAVPPAPVLARVFRPPRPSFD